jgi:hypothetical protein
VNFDLRAAVTSWVAQELELQCPGEDIGYWVQLQGQDTALPRVAITLVTAETETLRTAEWPPTERGPRGVRHAVHRGIQDIRRYYTEKDPK